MAHRPQTLHPAHAQEHMALRGGAVGLMSGENPLFPTNATHTGHEALAQALDGMGLDYEPTHGQYQGKPERSYIIHNPTVEQMQKLGKMFGQESVVHSQNGQPRLVYTNGANEGLATPPPDPAKHHGFFTAQPADDYTVVPGPHGEPYGWFRYNLDFDKPLQPVNPQAAPVTTLKAERMVGPVEAALRLAKGVVDEYHQVLLDLRMRELAKAEPRKCACGAPVEAGNGQPKETARFCKRCAAEADAAIERQDATKKAEVGAQVARHQEPGIHEPNGAPHTEPGVHERPAETAKKSEPSMKNSKVTDLLKAQVQAANAANGGQKKTVKSEVVASNKANGGGLAPVKKGIEEDVNADAHAMAARALKGPGYNKATPAGRMDILRTLDSRPTLGTKPPAAVARVQGVGAPASTALVPVPGGIRPPTMPTQKAEMPAKPRNKANGGPARLGKDEMEMSESLCKGCGSKMSPVAKALAKGHGTCGKCIKSAMEKGEWKPRAGKEQGNTEGTGHEMEKGKKLAKDAVRMSTPAAPKPPQAAGAKPTMHKAEQVPANKTNGGQVVPVKKADPGAGAKPQPGFPQPKPQATHPVSPGVAPSGLELDTDAVTKQRFAPGVTDKGPVRHLGVQAPPSTKKPGLPIAGLSRVVGYKKTEMVAANQANGSEPKAA